MLTKQYVLPKELHDSIFKRRVEKKYISNSKEQEKPLAIITGGQPGSGKSGITSKAKEELKTQGGHILVDADILRKQHPSYYDLLKKDDIQAANLTHQDASQWAVKLIMSAVENRRNLIIDQTSKDLAAFKQLATGLKQAGYTVEFRAMAVNEKVSEQRIYTRYEEQKKQNGFGRFSTKDKHDQAYKGLANVVEHTEALKLVDKSTLYNKDHKAVYTNQLEDDQWRIGPQASQLLKYERDRQMTFKELSELQNNYTKLKSLIETPERHATPAEVSNINKRLEEATQKINENVARQSKSKTHKI